MASVLVRASSKSYKLCTHCRGSSDQDGKDQHAFPFKMASCKWQEPSLHHHRVGAPVLDTRTHFVLHAQWVRKENTLSLLTKRRQLAKSFPLFITVLLAAGCKPGRETRAAPRRSGSEGHGWAQSWAVWLCRSRIQLLARTESPLAPGLGNQQNSERRHGGVCLPLIA